MTFRRFAAVLVPVLLVLVGVPAAHASTRAQVGAAAYQYAASRGYHVGIAVYDTKNGELHGSGYYKSTFASESVVKVFIATRLLVKGAMHGTTEQLAYKMITQSDDNIASALYGSVGGDSLITWVKSHYDVPDLGSPPSRAGWWGNTHITPIGLVKLYAKLKRDSKVSSWLLNAMHHATKYGSDGTYQFFGLPSATSHPAIKQGWGDDYDDWSRSADFNTTGFVDGDRYAVAILARGPISTYGSAIGTLLTHVAQILLPYSGWYPPPYPTITSLSPHTGSTAGGYVVTIYGTDFVGISGVSFGKAMVTSLHRVSASELQVRAPRHSAASGHVWVWTNHGHTLANAQSAFTYIAPPAVASVAPTSGPIAGGTVVTVTGTDFRSVRSVSFGSVAGTALHVSSSGALTVTAPAEPAGTVDVHVVTAYGTSSTVAADQYTYVAPPQITGITQTVPGVVRIEGSGFASVSSVRFGTVSVAPSSVTPTEIVVSVPAQPAGTVVPVQVVGEYGSSPAVAAGRYTYP